MSTNPTPSPVPAGFVIESFTAVSPSRWWLLGTVPCDGELCPEIAATADAGASFTTMPAPGGAYPASQATPPVSSIRFADPTDGWVFGPKLYATHDGGERWSAVNLPGRVAALEPGLGQVFATVDPPTPPCYRNGTCNASTPGPQLWRSTPGTNRWTVDAAAGYVSAGLAVHGQSVWITNSMATKDGPALGLRLLYSADGGDHFVTQPQPVTGVACDYQPVSNHVLWAYCSGGHFMFVYRSTDAGAHFTETQDTQTPNANNCPNGSRLAAATETTAVAACNLGGEPLLLTTHGGATWTVAQPALNHSGYWEPIGFTTPDVGSMLWRTGYGPTSVVQLWRTTDGGQSWQQVKTVS